MLTLLIDAGNTRCKLGWVTAGGARETTSLALDWHAGEAEWRAELSAWCLTLPAQADRVLGVNVAGGAAADRLADACRQWGWPAPQWRQAQACVAGVRNPYEQSAALGADRWAALLGLAARTADLAAQPLLLTSFGTATTVDVLAPAQATPAGLVRPFEGGLILPGPRLMAESLAAGTAQLPDVPAALADFPTNTAQAIASGIAAAQAGAVVRQWRLAAERHGRPAQVYVAGGGWPVVATEVTAALQGAGAPAPVLLTAPVLDGVAVLAALEPGGA